MAIQSGKPVALITGGTTGIGFATARLLHEKGYAVLVTGANPETLAAAQQSPPILSNGGSVLFTTAVCVEKGYPNYSVASATKGATAALVPALAAELAPRGIRVNAIRPGAIDTPAMDKLGLPADVIAGFRQMIPQRVPLARMGLAEEVAEVVAFLASPAVSYITGTTIDVDGGMSSGM